MSSSVLIFPEPEVEFRYGQRLIQPQDGLSLFGPYDGDAPSHPSSISYAVFGAVEGIELLRRWSERFRRAIVNEPDVDSDLWPSFPGFEAVTGAKWPREPAWTYEISRSSPISS